jgi:ubiquinone/menaquinone biosynthesis C-methylase UbiE
MRSERSRRHSGRSRAPYQPFANQEWRNSIQSRIEIPLLVRALDLPAGGRLLEIGCGRGVGLSTVSKPCRPDSLTGVDFDQALLEVARHRLTARDIDADLVYGDVLALPFPDESFDVVIDFGTCYHVAEPERAVAEVTRVLVPGGLFVHETRLSQFLAHPVRSLGNRIPWEQFPALVVERRAGLWARRSKLSAAGPAAPSIAA